MSGFSKLNMKSGITVAAIIIIAILVVFVVMAGLRIVRSVRDIARPQEKFAPIQGEADPDFPTQDVEFEKADGPSRVLLPDGAPFSDLLPDGGEDTDPNNLLSKISFLDAGHHAGVDTIGTTLKNASQDLRREPPNPKRVVAPWMMSTIEPDPMRRSLDF